MKQILITRKNLSRFMDDIAESDYEELYYFYKKDYKKEFIKTTLNLDNVYFLADDNDNPLALGGVVELNNKTGQVWLLVTNQASKHKKSIYRYVINKIESFKKKYNILFNCIYRSNFNALKWLHRCGFQSLDLENQNYKLFYYDKGEQKFDIRNITC